jgi:hypothetical protein
MKNIPKLKITSGSFIFDAQLETDRAPKTCSALISLLPYRQKLIHVRWSGEAVWVPLGEKNFDLSWENHTSYPTPGQMILYPGGISECEILLAYGNVQFSSKFGQLAGNHFLTITSNLELLTVLGEKILWEGAQDLLIEIIN